MKNQKGYAPLGIVLLFILFLGVSILAYSRITNNDNSSVSNLDLSQIELKNTLTEPTKAFTFTAAGDFKNEANADAVLRAIGAAESDFTLALGDFSYAGNGSEPEWCNFVSERVGSNHPFQLIAGNHDDGESEGDIAEYVKCLPNKLPDVVGTYGIEYYFDYENLARFILISPDIDNYGFDYFDSSEHLQWIVDAVEDARAKGIEWIVLGMHKNCISAGEKTCEIGEDLLNTAIDLKIDIVLQGHEHAYFRSKQLALNPDTCPAIVVNEFNEACVSESSNDMQKGAGTVIVISGAGGYKLRDVNLDDPEYEYFNSVNGSNIGNSYGYSNFVVTKGGIDATFVPAIGEFTDSFSIKE